MLATVPSSALVGIQAHPVTVEVDVSNGLPGFCMVGLPDSVVKESRDRVFAAIRNSNYTIPSRRIVVSLAPAELKKVGSAYDLPIALGILMASQQIEPFKDPMLVIGELSLEGEVRAVRGLLSIVHRLSKNPTMGLLFPRVNLEEALAFPNLDLRPVESLQEAIERGHGGPIQQEVSEKPKEPQEQELDLFDIKGQAQAKRALEIAAAGSHNFLMMGSPGCGKSLMARRLPSILPSMTKDESIVTTMIYSAAGVSSKGLLETRPFRSPHHIISNSALVGGGIYPKPGEVSLAHNGVLFLDELAEFPKSVLESLRQPLEDGFVTIARTAVTISYPSQVMLGAAMNPCPCGFLGHPVKPCLCQPFEIKRYLAKVSGPLLDRIDIQLEIPSLSYDEISNKRSGESSESVRERVEEARRIQWKRFETEAQLYCNAQMNTRQVRTYCPLDSPSQKLMKDVMMKLGFSGRAYDRILRMARTIADLDGEVDILERHLGEAICYRNLDRAKEYMG